MKTKNAVVFLAMIALLAAVPLTFLAQSQNNNRAEVQFQAAQHKAFVDGDLKGAIEQYKKIAVGSDRPIAAKALVAMAECYQKLGDVEAQRIYERVLREFADQTEAVSVARAHLGRTGATSAGMTSRRVLVPALDHMFGGTVVSPDGRLLAYTDWKTGDLAVYDLMTGGERRLTNKADQSGEYAESYVVSKDGRRVAYSWFNGKDRYELRLVSLEGAGTAEPQVLFSNADVRSVWLNDWSPDGKWIAVDLSRRDNSTTQMGLISVLDGSLRVLKSFDWSSSLEVFFSPDSKYVGFDAAVGDSRNDQRDVFVLAVDGSREVAAVVSSSNDTMMGWSPDGKNLLFASDRGGTVGLWAVPIADGAPLGPPELVKSDISRNSLGVTATGSLYTGVDKNDRDIQVATMDFETGKFVAGPVRPIQRFVGTNYAPSWSPDGKYLAYVSERRLTSTDVSGNNVLGILSVGTTQVRELRPQLAYFGNIRWSPDGRSFIVNGTDLKGRQGQYQIDAQTSEVTVPPADAALQKSPDGTKAYIRKSLGADGFSFVERDAASGNEREIIRRKGLGGMGLSPDGRFIATIYTDESTKSSSLLLIPVSGGEPRDLLKVSRPLSLVPSSWMPDGRAILVAKQFDDPGHSHNEVWLVPTVGGQPRKTELANASYGFLRVHPDGHQVAFVAGDNNTEVWALENFLPALNAKK